MVGGGREGGSVGEVVVGACDQHGETEGGRVLQGMFSNSIAEFVSIRQVQ